ncbi:MAG: phosphate acyltransferase PlsX [Nitrospinota bacterium]|nr:phosphate acyltransferase PlsX [Nitrospinota bacterium]
MKIAVDAMGGDSAPRDVVEGAYLALKEFRIETILVGLQDRIQSELDRLGITDFNFDIREAKQVVEMGESPTKSAKEKQDSSIRVALELVKRGEASAVFTAGDTGGAFTAALFVLKKMRDVQRPAIAAVIPTLKGFAVMVDVGANLNPRAQHIFQFGIMGSVYSEVLFGKKNPKIGLLNIGSEESKGTDALISSHDFFSKSDLNFIGNIEGSTIFQGISDVVVSDGFSGNVALKVSESVSSMISSLLRTEFNGSVKGKIGYLFLRDGINTMRRKTDYSEYGAAPLLGLNGLCTIGHGRSDAKTIKNAIRTTNELVKKDLNSKLQENIARYSEIYRSSTSDVGWRLWNQIRGGIFSGDESDKKDI